MRLSFSALALLGLGLAVAGRGQDEDLSKRLADAQDRLSTSLHSYTLLSDENAKLKADLDRAAAENARMAAQLDTARRANENLKILAAAAAQYDPMRTQLRQMQDQVAALAQQNYELKNKLAMQGPAPAARPPLPNRPTSP